MIGHVAVTMSLLVQPAPAAPPETEQDIVVVGPAREYRLTGRELRAAVAAYRKHRGAFAPRSRLWFEVAARGSAAAAPKLTLTNGTSHIPLEIGPDGRFAFPDVAGDGWRLVGARSNGPLRLRPWVVSPRTTPNDIRLGDLQVQCRVGWAIARQSASFVVAGLFDAAGGCRSSRIALYQDFGREIAAATIAEGGRQAAVATWHGTALRMPTYLANYTPEARVRIRFR